MKKPNKVTITFNPDHEGVYLLLGIDDDFHKIYISEQQHGNILQSCVDSYFKKKSIGYIIGVVTQTGRAPEHQTGRGTTPNWS